MSSKIKPAQIDNISWTNRPEYALKVGLCSCGCIIYTNYIITFGE